MLRRKGVVVVFVSGNREREKGYSQTLLPQCLTVKICIQNEVCVGNALRPWRYVVDVDSRAWL